MAGIDDLATIQKNGVVAVNSLVQTLDAFRAIYESVAGSSSVLGVDADAKIFTGAGRLATVSVTVAASGGTIHDSASVAEATSSNVIFAIPNAVGITVVNFPISNGLIVKPGAGSTVSISYSEAS